VLVGGFNSCGIPAQLVGFPTQDEQILKLNAPTSFEASPKKSHDVLHRPCMAPNGSRTAASLILNMVVMSICRIERRDIKGMIFPRDCFIPTRSTKILNLNPKIHSNSSHLFLNII
jgi:hypothetical protein